MASIKKFVFDVLDSLIVLLMGVAGLVILPILCAIFGLICGLGWSGYGFVVAARLAFGPTK